MKGDKVILIGTQYHGGEAQIYYRGENYDLGTNLGPDTYAFADEIGIEDECQPNENEIRSMVCSAFLGISYSTEKINRLEEIIQKICHENNQ